MTGPLSTEPTQDDDQQDSTGQAQQPSRATLAPRLSVVGIGASAGGLTALRTFFGALPADTGMSFVVVVHLSPEHESILAELLQPHTEMPVAQVTERVEMQPDHVYVIPPAKRLLVTEGHLELAEFDMPRGHRLQIDVFFRSLAEHHGDGAAIILSGSGSDGAVGIQSIKEGGGLILVQDPDEAEYNDMPKSAIATGLVDVVAPTRDVATLLVAAKRTGAALELPADPADLSSAAEETLTQILAHLRVRTGHDFGGYKRTTMLRRVGRRMQLAQIQTLSAYLHRVRQDAEEVDALFRDLLIHVTEFFREPEAWETLAQTIIPRLFKSKSRDDQVRVWTVGCATGEEAYGLAILLLEYAATLKQAPQIQVFASDLGDLALDFARKGIYPEAIAANVSPERLKRFFSKENSHYRVRDELRQVVLFTPHNLLQDPPFSKLDLILCRNLLIYLQRTLQEQVFQSFHYALRRDGAGPGYLFLGSAESPDGVTELFEAVDKRHHIYRRSPQYQSELVLPALPLLPQVEPRSGVWEAERDERPQQFDREHGRLAEIAGPPSLLVDDQYRILHLSNAVGRYLQPPDGMPTDDALRIVRPELENELRTALFRALEVGKATLTRPAPVTFNGAPHPVSMLVRPVQGESDQLRALIFFLEDETPLEDVGADGAAASQGGAPAQLIRAELGQVQSQLQTLRQEYETTVEELRAANEELQSTNEEYRSTLEELETGKEELQSINEELQSVNHQLKNKMEETVQAHNDLQNLFTATEIATLFLDRELRVKRYTPAAAEIFNLMPPDLERPIGHLRGTLSYDELEVDARLVLRKLSPVQRQVQQDVPDNGQHWFQVNVRPYRTHNDRIEGVVITFVDITANKKNELALQQSEEQLAVELAAMRHLQELVARLLGSPDLNTALEEILTASIEIAGADMGTIQILDPATNQLEIVAQRGFQQDFLARFRRVGRDDPSVYGRAFAMRKRVVVQDVQTEPLYEPYREIAAAAGYHGVQSTPLLSRDGQVLGILSTHYRQPLLPSERDLRMLDLYARQAADYIELARGEEALRRSEERLRKMINTEGLGVLFFDESGVLVDANDAFFHMTGYSQTELEAHTLSWRSLTPPEYLEISEQQMQKLVETGRIGPYEKEYLHKDGSRSWMLLVGASLDDGTIIKYCIDVNDRKQAEAALQQLNEQLEDRVEERTQQVRHLSTQLTLSEQTERRRISQILHDDLQQCLYGLQFQLSGLRDLLQREDRARALEVLEECGEFLETAVETTRNLSVSLSPPILEGEGLPEALHWLASQMERRHGLTVLVQTTEDVPMLGEARRILLFQVVRELLFNVVKHAGIAQAEVSLARANDQIHIEVIDEGDGFDVESLWGHAEAGHGLLRSRQRLEIVGGSMQVESIPGDGTRVLIECPLH